MSSYPPLCLNYDPSGVFCGAQTRNVHKDNKFFSNVKFLTN